MGAATPETPLAAALDLAEGALHRGDLDEAAAWLDEAGPTVGPDLVFGWRQQLKLRGHRARLALACDEPGDALRLSRGVASAAESLALPRYAAPARIVAARALARLGEPVDRDAVAADLDVVARSAQLEVWWVTAEAAVDLGIEQWLDRAEAAAAALHRAAGDRGAGGERAVGTWLAARRAELARTAR